MKFSWLHPTEKVLLHRRQHPLIWIGVFVVFLLLALIPYLVIYYWQYQLSTWLLFPGAHLVGVMVISWYYLLWWTIFFGHWLDYYLDHWVLTDRRLVSIKHVGVFRRNVVSLSLDQVEDVTMDIRGLSGMIFNYGLIVVRSASSKSGLRFYAVAKPASLVRKISLEVARYKL